MTIVLFFALLVIHGVAMGATDKSVVFIVMSESRTTFTNKFAYSIVVLDGLTDKVLQTIPIGESANDIAISPSGKLAYVASDGGNELIAVDLGTAAILSRTKLSDPTGVAFSVNGKLAYVTQFPSSIAVVDTSSHTIVDTVTNIPGPMYIVMSPDGFRAYVTYDDGIAVLDTGSSELIDAIELPNPSGITISPDGSVVYASNANSKVVIAIDTASNKISKRLNIGKWPSRISVTPDGQMLLVVDGHAQTIHVIDTLALERVSWVPMPSNKLGAIAVSPDGALAYVTNGDFMDGAVGAVFVINVAGKYLKSRLPMVDNNPSDIETALVIDDNQL